MIPLRLRLVLVLLTAVPGFSAAQDSTGRGDPVTTDPAQVDTTYPPSTEELAFLSHGARLNGFFYLAPGKGPHPTVILLHGFPGNERNLDLAQALRRAGTNVLFFSYRGAWASGGSFSFEHALEDVAAAIAFVRRDSSITAFRVDPRRVSLIGHSMGGWLALMHAAVDSSIACTVALDFWNVGDDGRRMPTDRQLDSTATAYTTWLTTPGGPLHADGGPALVAEMKAHGEEWDPVRLAPALARRPLLVISTTANQSHPRLVAALHAAHPNRLTAMQWQTDHGFSDRRIGLARLIVSWLGKGCRK